MTEHLVLHAVPEDLMTRSVAPDDVSVQRDGLVRALMVPWMTPADIAEVRLGRLLEYREQFARGAFGRAEKAPHRVTLAWTHSTEFGNLLGRGVEFLNDPAGAVGLFRLLPAVADKAREAIDGSGVSISFRTIRPQYGSERAGELVTRTEAHLSYLAVVDNPAYLDAQVLAVREADAEAAEQAQQRQADVQLLARSLALLEAGGHPMTGDQASWLAAWRVSGQG